MFRRAPVLSGPVGIVPFMTVVSMGAGHSVLSQALALDGLPTGGPRSRQPLGMYIRREFSRDAVGGEMRGTGTFKRARKVSAADVARALESGGRVASGKAAATGTQASLVAAHGIVEIMIVDEAISRRGPIEAGRSFAGRCQIGVAERGLFNLESPTGFARYMLGKFPSWIC